MQHDFKERRKEAADFSAVLQQGVSHGRAGLLIIKGFRFFRKAKFPVSGIGKWIFVMSSPTEASCFFSRIDLIYLCVHCGWTHGLINGPVNDCGGYS